MFVVCPLCIHWLRFCCANPFVRENPFFRSMLKIQFIFQTGNNKCGIVFMLINLILGLFLLTFLSILSIFMCAMSPAILINALYIPYTIHHTKRKNIWKLFFDRIINAFKLSLAKFGNFIVVVSSLRIKIAKMWAHKICRNWWNTENNSLDQSTD